MRNTVARFLLLLLVCALGVPSMSAQKNQVMSELRFQGNNDADKNAGVWIDGQYVGFVKELNGDKKISLLPGKHEILVRQAWYKDFTEETVLEPGQVYMVKVALVKDSQPSSQNANAELKIVANPDRAAVFVDGEFAGHVNEFQGAGKAMLLTPGKHDIRLELPGYQPFETTLDLRPHQKAKVETSLLKGSVTESGSLVSHQ